MKLQIVSLILTILHSNNQRICISLFFIRYAHSWRDFHTTYRYATNDVQPHCTSAYFSFVGPHWRHMFSMADVFAHTSALLMIEKTGTFNALNNGWFLIASNFYLSSDIIRISCNWFSNKCIYINSTSLTV